MRGSKSANAMPIGCGKLMGIVSELKITIFDHPVDDGH